MAKLTDRQQRFVNEYLANSNATEAYKRAGYKGQGHSAESGAAQLMRNSEVAAAIAEGQKRLSQDCELDQRWVLNRLKIESTREDERSSHSARVTAAVKIGEHIGMWKDDKDSRRNVGHIIIIEVPREQQEPTILIEVSSAGGADSQRQGERDPLSLPSPSGATSGVG